MSTDLPVGLKWSLNSAALSTLIVPTLLSMRSRISEADLQKIYDGEGKGEEEGEGCSQFLSPTHWPTAVSNRINLWFHRLSAAGPNSIYI